MLYFTSRLERIGAVYTGRFAFIVNATAEWIAGAVARMQQTAVLDDPEEHDVAEAFAEEYRHSQLFLSCRSGLLLGGVLVFVRVIWLACRSRRAVYEYYRLRTAFFAVMYPLHEESVSETKERQPSEQAPEDLQQRLCEADDRVWAAWKELLPRPAVVVLLLTGPVCRALGRAFARHFTVISQEYRSGRLYEHNHAVGGFINDLYSDRAPLPLLVRRMLWAIRPESVVPNTVHMDWDWMLLKFLAERDTWPLVRDHQATTRSFLEYCADVLAFVGEWVQLHQARPIATICSAVAATRSYTRLPPLPDGWEGDPRLRKMVNFFYLHGN